MLEKNTDYGLNITIHDLGGAVSDAVDRAHGEYEPKFYDWMRAEIKAHIENELDTDNDNTEQVLGVNEIEDIVSDRLDDAIESALDCFKEDLYIDSDMVDGLDGAIEGILDEWRYNYLSDYIQEELDNIGTGGWAEDIDHRLIEEIEIRRKQMNCHDKTVQGLVLAVERLESRTIRGRWLAFRGLCRRMVERIKYPVNFWSM